MTSNMRLTKTCQHCKELFIAKTTVTKYCSDVCAKRAYKVRKRKAKIETSNKQTALDIQKPIEAIKVKDYLTIQETCQLVGISRTTLWRLLKVNKLRSTKIGKRVIIQKSDLTNFLNSNSCIQ